MRYAFHTLVSDFHNYVKLTAIAEAWAPQFPPSTVGRWWMEKGHGKDQRKVSTKAGKVAGTYEIVVTGVEEAAVDRH